MSADATPDAPLAHDTHATAHTTSIIVNAAPHDMAGKEFTYNQVVNLAYHNAPPSGPNVVITVNYSRGEHGQEGTMLPGDAVKLKTKMVFDVSATDRS